MEILRIILVLALFSCAHEDKGMEVGEAVKASPGIKFEGLSTDEIPKDCKGKRNTKGCEEEQ